MEKEFWRRYKTKGLVVVGISLAAEREPLKMAQMFVKKHKLTYTVAYDPKQDSKVAEVYQVERLPTNIVISRDGKIRYQRQGFDAKSLKKAIEAALKEPAPKRATKRKGRRNLSQ